MTDIALYARAYAHAGLSVFPIDHGGKRPLAIGSGRFAWSKFAHRIMDDREIEDWFGKSPVNIGIICGAVSGNLCVLDFDNTETWLYFTMLRPEIFQRTKIAQSGREEPGPGFHVYCRLDVPTRKSFAIDPVKVDEKGYAVRLGLDVQADGGTSGSYVVAPPSVHASGNAYRWLNPEVKSIGRFQETEIHEWVHALGGVLTYEDVRRGGPGPGKGGHWISDLLLSGAKYHDGDGRNRALNSLAGYLRKHEPYDIGLAIGHLWNASLADPMDEQEVERVIQSTYKYGSVAGDGEEEANIIDAEESL